MKTYAFCLALAITWLHMGAVAARAQARAVGVSGTVTDEQAAVLQGAVVVLAGGGQRVETTTGSDGTFSFAHASSGPHTVIVSLSGFAPQERQVQLVDEAVSLSITLRLASRSEHVTVTAQKHEQSVTDVGMSITTMAGASLANEGIVTTGDLARAVPGLTYAVGPYGIPVYTLRGLGNDDNESMQQSPTVGVYVDDLSLPYSILTRGAQSDLERVEVLKGPQGTLFGLSTTGGAINYVVRKPTRELNAGLTVEAGRFGRYALDGFVSGPLTDTLSGRLSVTTHQGGAWQQSASRGDERGDEGLTSARGQLLWTPSKRFSARVSYFGWRDTGDPLAGQVLGVTVQNPTSPARSVLQQTAVSAGNARGADWPTSLAFGRNQAFHSASAHLTSRLANNIELTSKTGYGMFSRDDMQPGGGGPVQNVDLQATGTIDLFSEEVRLSRVGRRLTWITGLHYGENDVRHRGVAFIGTNSATELITNVLDIDTFYNDGHQKSHTFGGFGHVEWSAADTWRLTLGARYTDERKGFSACTGDPGNGSGPATFLNIALRTTVFTPGQCTSIGPDGLPGRFVDTLEEKDLSGRIGLDWKPRADLLVYGNASRGFKAGAFPILAANSHAQLEPVTAERVHAYEGGIKATLAGGAPPLNRSAGEYDYTDKQIRGSLIDPIFRVLSQLVNVPKSRVTGAEVDLTVRPTSDLSMSVGAAWLDTEIIEFVGYDRQGRLQDLAGARFPLAPAGELNARIDYERRLARGLLGFLSGDASYNSRTQGTADFVGLPEYGIDAYTVVNTRVGVASLAGAWQLTAWVRNLTNEYYWLNAQRLGDLNIRWAGPPRTFGITLGYRWR